MRAGEREVHHHNFYRFKEQTDGFRTWCQASFSGMDPTFPTVSVLSSTQGERLRAQCTPRMESCYECWPTTLWRTPTLSRTARTWNRLRRRLKNGMKRPSEMCEGLRAGTSRIKLDGGQAVSQDRGQDCRVQRRRELRQQQPAQWEERGLNPEMQAAEGNEELLMDHQQELDQNPAMETAEGDEVFLMDHRWKRSRSRSNRR